MKHIPPVSSDEVKESPKQRIPNGDFLKTYPDFSLPILRAEQVENFARHYHVTPNPLVLLGPPEAWQNVRYVAPTKAELKDAYQSADPEKVIMIDSCAKLDKETPVADTPYIGPSALSAKHLRQKPQTFKAKKSLSIKKQRVSPLLKAMMSKVK